MDRVLNRIASTVRSAMLFPARALNAISGGRIKPNHVTLVSLLGHLLVVWALYKDHPLWAALFLAFFGIMDTLDGALAKLQKTTSLKGMLYDATSDRVKEVLVYVGLALSVNQIYYIINVAGDSYWHYHYLQWYFVNNITPMWIIVAVCGMSLVVSYIKAKGEMALSGTGKYDAQQLNRIFSDGFARYEVRMALIILGLITGTTFAVLHLLLILLIITALQRIIRVSKALGNV